ncbi:MAG: hypothetical protein ACI4EN_10520 [Butyrivibrio sp.]
MYTKIGSVEIAALNTASMPDTTPQHNVTKTAYNILLSNHVCGKKCMYSLPT